MSTTRYDRLTAAVDHAVKATTRKADLPAAIVDALLDAELTLFTDGVTVFVADPTLAPTDTVHTDQGVVIEYRADTPISYHFPAPIVTEVQA
jgi:hypothetical protein